MLNPTSLFVACLLTLAANPSLVSSIPLPPAFPLRSASSVLRHRSFKSVRKLPVLRIVDDEQYSEPASWIEAFTEESILPESIFATDNNNLGSNLLHFELASIHRPHNFRRDLPPSPSKPKKSSTSSKKVKRNLSETSHGSKHEKRFSSRWQKGQEAAKSREAAAKASSTSSSIVWTRVTTTAQSVATSSSSELVSAPSTTITTSSPSASPTAITLSGTYSGDGTWFAPGLGACGTVATDDSPIVAVSHLLYDNYPGATINPNNNPICGQKIRATYAGKTVDVTVQDRCTGCAMWDLDFSPKLFGELADLDLGRLKNVEWTFI